MTKPNLLIFLTIFLYSCTSFEPPKPIMPLPSGRQLVWHEMEFYAFVHFNMNTFTNMEWGFGNENPQLFNPSQLDCRQWAKVCKEAGMKGIILTAKHHDGFCLWPSSYTEHSVKNSPWKNGKGDVVRELSDACREYGLKFGVYLSPWDRNHADYGKPEYLNYFRNQLRELLTNYGEIYEVWFDGANGGNGWYGGANETRKIDNKTYYDWENTYKIVRELQANACMFSDAGPDIRWVGNEEGWARETNWCMLNKDSVAPGVVSDLEWLRSGQENGTHWLPAEVDVSIRPGWYYHNSEDQKVKTLPKLLDIYYSSVGRNASLLINFPVDTRGLIHENDVEQILKLAETIKNDFSVNLVEGKKITSSNYRGNSKMYKPENIIDNNPETYWATDDSVIRSSIIVDFGKSTEFNRVVLQEDIRFGQRIRNFSVEALVNNEWQLVDNQTTIGRKRILRFPNVVANQLRINIINSRAIPILANIGVYNAPKVIIEPIIQRNKSGEVSIQGFDNGLDIYFTTDGTNPTVQSTKYKEPFLLQKKSKVKAIVADPGTGKTSPVSVGEFDVSKINWILKGGYEKDEHSDFMFDGNPETAFILGSKMPVEIIVDLADNLNIEGFTYLPDQQRWNPGIISSFEFYVSMDGKNWGNPVSQGEFANIKNNPVLQKKDFDPVKGRFIKFKAIAPSEENGRTGIAEFAIITR